VAAKPPITNGLGGINMRRSASSSRSFDEGRPALGADPVFPTSWDLMRPIGQTSIILHIGRGVNPASKKILYDPESLASGCRQGLSIHSLARRAGIGTHEWIPAGVVRLSESLFFLLRASVSSDEWH
jgi:hypothetical protein